MDLARSQYRALRCSAIDKWGHRCTKDEGHISVDDKDARLHAATVDRVRYVWA